MRPGPLLYGRGSDYTSQRLDACGALLLLLTPIVIHAVWRHDQRYATVALADSTVVQSTVNPNSAPWWELTILPGVGPTKARDIVGFREQRGSALGSDDDDDSVPSIRPLLLVFRRAADLDQVRGIGPKTIARIENELRFDDSSGIHATGLDAAAQ